MPSRSGNNSGRFNYEPPREFWVGPGTLSDDESEDEEMPDAGQENQGSANIPANLLTNIPNDYGIRYGSPSPFWVGPGSSDGEAEDESMPDSNQGNQPPANTPANPSIPSSPSQDSRATYEDESEPEQYEELESAKIRNLATSLGVADVDAFERLAQSPQAFHAVSQLVRFCFLNRAANFLDYACWHLARRVFVAGTHNVAAVGVRPNGSVLAHEWGAVAVARLFEAMELLRRDMGLEPWESTGSKSFNWRLSYGLLLLYLNGSEDMAHALLTDNGLAANYTRENRDRIEAITGAVNAFYEILCEDEEYDINAAGSYPRSLRR